MHPGGSSFAWAYLVAQACRERLPGNFCVETMRVIRADSPEAPQARYVPAPVAVVARRPHDAAPVLVGQRKMSSVLLSSCTWKPQLRDPLKGGMVSAVHGNAQATKFH